MICVSVAGKMKMKSGTGAFVVAASREYKCLPESEKTRLIEAAKTCKPKITTKASSQKAATKIFKKIQKQVFRLHCDVILSRFVCLLFTDGRIGNGWIQRCCVWNVCR